MSDDQTMYRTEDELKIESQKDVVNSYPETLTSLGLMSEKEVQQLKENVAASVKEAMSKAIATPWPEVEEATKHLYSDETPISGPEFDSPSTVTGKEDVPMAQSINQVLKSEVAKKMVSAFPDSKLIDVKDK